MRHLLILLSAAIAAVWASTLAAQQDAKIRQIGTLSIGSRVLPHLDTAFLRGLQEHGYIAGKNIVLHRRYAQGDLKRLPDLAAELVRLKVDLIFTVGDEAIGAVQRATGSIPIVMIACDALEAGLVSNLARPGGI